MAIRGMNQMSGNWGQIWWDGELIFELEQFSAKVTAKREEVQIGMDVDSKITALSGEITFRIKKVYSRGKKKLLEAWQQGLDPRSSLVGKLADPDTIGKQSESMSINNIWFNDVTLLQFEQGTKLTEEYTCGFTPGDARFLTTVDVKEQK